jgi:hypothetical protein
MKILCLSLPLPNSVGGNTITTFTWRPSHYLNFVIHKFQPFLATVVTGEIQGEVMTEVLPVLVKVIPVTGHGGL